ncbi:TPA: hypothetical protein N3A18_000584 [Salmonella enterica subsp. arizonae serovar 56:z4,z23:-]|nr:hypothetical protein [Salmonella enterica]EKH2048451.1 hypothetical protein [Salmonella enterica]HCM1854105.1 hypothetical protein [Salmonella enterica subsp. arizonae serovar 56:z4,z23:-]
MNKQLSDYLDYYFKLPNSPGFAVMIDGSWGSGKTWYISKFCENGNYKDLSIFNISLYGLNHITQIDEEIFKQAHPILSHKGVLIAGALTKAALKATVRIDLDGDKKDDVNLSLSIPSVDFKKISKNPSESVLIFDDFERTSVPLKELLGYINHFVERNGCKVVILTNENEIIKFNEEYSKTKEKMIGATFRYKSNISEAYNTLIDEINSCKLKEYLLSFRDGFIDIYEKSGCTNFRMFRNFLMDFERFFNILASKIKEHDKTIEHLLYVYFIFYFETKQNGLSTYSNSMFYPSDDQKLTVADLNTKYQRPLFVDMILSADVWAALMNNEVDSERINKEISESRFYFNPVAPEWVKLWGFNFLDDEEFMTLRDIVKKQLQDKTFNNANIIRHVVGLMLELSRNSLIDFEPCDIVKAGVDCAKHAFDTGIYQPTENYHGQKGYWGGLEIYSSDTSEYSSFSKEINIFDIEMKNIKLSEVANDIFFKMKECDNSFIPMLVTNKVNIRSYDDEPVLKFISEESFVNLILNTTSGNRSSICYNLFERYKKLYPDSPLLLEYEWFHKVVTGIEIKVNALKSEKCLTQHNVQRVLREYLNPALENFKKFYLKS